MNSGCIELLRQHRLKTKDFLCRWPLPPYASVIMAAEEGNDQGEVTDRSTE